MESFAEFLEKEKKITKRNICYLDDNGNVVDKEKATNCIITEYDSDGNIINSVHGIIDNVEDKEEER